MLRTLGHEQSKGVLVIILFYIKADQLYLFE